MYSINFHALEKKKVFPSVHFFEGRQNVWVDCEMDI